MNIERTTDKPYQNNKTDDRQHTQNHHINNTIRSTHNNQI